MELAELSVRTALPVRKLRYVVDHRLLPGRRRNAPGHGVPRSVTGFEAFAIAVAARLLVAGVTRRVVKAVMAVACRTDGPHAPSRAPLDAAFAAGGGQLEIGDGSFVRLSVLRRPGVRAAVDTGWQAAEEAEQVSTDYTPIVRVVVDLGGLTRAVQPPTAADS